MSIKKRYVKSTGICKCTFRIPKEAVASATQVHLVGDFNDWSTISHPMQRLKSGEFKLDMALEPGKDYQFRYLVDQLNWENDWDADSYRHSNAVASDNSVVSV